MRKIPADFEKKFFGEQKKIGNGNFPRRENFMSRSVSDFASDFDNDAVGNFEFDLKKIGNNRQRKFSAP